jgi:hypothetical protein
VTFPETSFTPALRVTVYSLLLLSGPSGLNITAVLSAETVVLPDTGPKEDARMMVSVFTEEGSMVSSKVIVTLVPTGALWLSAAGAVVFTVGAAPSLVNPAV